MNDKELYQKILGLPNPWRVTDVRLDTKANRIEIAIEYPAEEAVHCSICGERTPIHDHQKRKWRHLDTCQFETIIMADIPRSSCSKDGIHQIQVPWAEEGSRFTAFFEALAIIMLKEMSLSGVSRVLRLSWEQASGIQERAVERGMKRRKNKAIKHLAIDETSFQKRHEYVTVITDRENGCVQDILDDRKAETLENWLNKKSQKHLEAVTTVTMDMWDPFILAVKNTIPLAEQKISFDRFHVAGHFIKALNKVRAQEHRSFQRLKKESPLKGTQHDWLINSARVDNRDSDRRDFMLLTRSVLKTARAWAIKETAGTLWSYHYRKSAEKAWRKLLGWISRCRLDPVIKVGRMIKRYLWGILNAVIMKITNAIAEGINSRIQWIKKMACGFRNRSRFRNAILFHLGGLNMMPCAMIR